MEAGSYYERKELWDRPLTPQEQERIDLVHAAWPEGVKTVLDVGCGNGALGNFLPGGGSVTGLDFSHTALQHFRGRRVLGSVGRLPFRDRSFDLVLCADTLEHLRAVDFHACLAELRRVAARFLLIVSPHAEDLEAGSTRCLDCGTVFHVNWHVRSLTRDQFDAFFGDAFRVQSYAYFGPRWERWHPLVIRLAQAFGRRFARWEDAVCPLCGARQGDLAGPAPEAPMALLEEVERMLPAAEPRGDDRCEVLVLFERGCPAAGAGAPYAAAPRLLLLPAGAEPGPVRLVLRDRGTVHMGSPLCASAVTEADPERGYVITNELTDWGGPYRLDGRWVRNVEDCGGRDGHALFVLPWRPGAPGTIAVSYKDVTREPIRLEVYDAKRGYLAVGTLAGAGTGEWKDAIFPLPSQFAAGRSGLIAHFVPDRGTHPGEPHPIAHVGYPGSAPRSLPVDPEPSTVEASNTWTAEYPTAMRRGRDEAVVESGEPCVMMLALPTGERYVLGRGRELAVPGWLHDSLQGDSWATAAESGVVQRASLGEREPEVSALQGALGEREAQLGALQGTLGEREAQLGALQGTLGEREAQLGALQGTLGEREAQLGALQGTLGEREAQLGALQGTLGEREAQLGALQGTLGEREAQLGALQGTLGEREAQLGALQATLAEREAQLGALQATLAEREAQLGALRAMLGEREAQLGALQATLGEREAEVTGLRAMLGEQAAEVETLRATLAERGAEVARLSGELSGAWAEQEREAALAHARRQELEADLVQLRAEMAAAAALARQAAAEFQAYRASIGIRQMHQTKQTVRRWLGRPPPDYP